jgi:hypothetical protein
MIGNQTSGKPVIGSGKESFVRFSTNELLAKPPTDRCCAAPLALMKPFFDGEA